MSSSLTSCAYQDEEVAVEVEQQAGLPLAVAHRETIVGARATLARS
jgi:hypothetical protein